jgi:hypothetical protein
MTLQFDLSSIEKLLISVGTYFCGFDNICLITATCYYGDSTTKEAQNVAEFLGKLMNTKQLLNEEKLNLMFLMSQVQSRNLCIQNEIFKINWNVLLTVSMNK